MIVDELRSFHFGPAKMVLGSGEEFYVRWYKAAPGAKPLPFPNFMGHPIWMTASEWTNAQLGMSMDTPPGKPGVGSPYVWAPTRYPAPPGQHYHGLQEWFEHGLPADKLFVGVRTDLCGEPLIDGDGGLDVDASGDIYGLGAGGVVGQGDIVADGSSTMPITILETVKSTTTFTGGPFDNVPLADATCFRWAAPPGTQFTGLARGTSGRLVIVENVGPDMFQLMHDSPASLPQNRIYTIDRSSFRIYPGYAGWLQYDGASSRWREINSVPLIQQPGDLLTANPSGPVRFPVSTEVGHVLRAQPGEPEGILWGDPSGGSGGGGDVNYPRQSVPLDGLGERWYGSSFIHAQRPSFARPIVDWIHLFPFISPRGGTIGSIGAPLEIPGGALDFMLLGVYKSVSGGNLVPGNLLFSSNPIVLDGSEPLRFDFEWKPDPTAVYWLAAQYNLGSGIYVGKAWLTPPGQWHPLLGADDTGDSLLIDWWQIAPNPWAGVLPPVCPPLRLVGRPPAVPPVIQVHYKP